MSMKRNLLWLMLTALLPAVALGVRPGGDPASRSALREAIEASGESDVAVAIVARSEALPTGESFRVTARDGSYTISSPSVTGLLYGACALPRLKTIGENFDTIETPAYELRILNHWDNLDGTVERGYAGRSLWKWNELPDTLSPRYREYALKCAEVGINGTVLNNVNASPLILSDEYLPKVKALADALRPYGLRTYLAVNFASPMVIGGLPTADPLDGAVERWWADKAAQIYEFIPDFGGFLVKANSEGQPGPGDYGRSHSEGANMIARALEPYGGIVMWRAFVYAPSADDRAKQAYTEFKPLDGSFLPNVIVQVKNGPIDFQPREPYSPLFGAMTQTPLMAELQITQEYLGHANHIAYLAPMWEEFFGQIDPSQLAGVAGVANIGDGEVMTGNLLADANRYAFGRLAWNPRLTSAQIAREWTGAHLYKDEAATPEAVKQAVEDMLLASREAVVDYMMPLGLHHIFAGNHHYGPEPWYWVEGMREDWAPRYYHRADSLGLGFDRTATGSDAVSQYPEELAAVYGDISRCPERLLLWFHHVPWTHTMASGRTLWDELCVAYQRGVDTVDSWQAVWEQAEPYVDGAVYADVSTRLATQAKDARWWRDACLLYFGQYSGMPLPEGVEPPARTLEEYMKVALPITNFESPAPELLDQYR